MLTKVIAVAAIEKLFALSLPYQGLKQPYQNPIKKIIEIIMSLFTATFRTGSGKYSG